MTDRLPPLDLDTLPDPVDVSDNTEALAAVRAVIDAGPYTDTWESLQRYTVPEWYQDAKLGIFIHWGVYNVPAFGSEWYSRHMYEQGSEAFAHHVATYGDQKDFGYKDFIPSYKMERFDPAAWAELFRKAGAQFVVPVAEHHDGFTQYDTDRSRWSAAKMGPQRDVFGDLVAAVDDAWMVKGASSHRAEHWFFMNGGTKFDSDVLDPRTQDFYGPAQRKETAPNARFLEDWLLRTVEIIDKYRPQVLWFDWWIEHPAFKPYLAQLGAYYYNRAAEWGREVVINYKWDAFAEGSAVYDIERGAMGEIRPFVWQNDTSVSKNSWSWVPNHDYKSPDDLIVELVDVVAKNGVLLLNVGPKADGTIADEEQELLVGLGKWLQVNGEAIYGTRPWAVSGEGPTTIQAGSFVDAADRVFTGADFRFTSRSHLGAEYVYAVPLGDPVDGAYTIRSFGTGAGLLAAKIKDVALFGESERPQWEQTAEGLVVRTGKRAVLKATLEPETAHPRWDFF
ncbi:alpha-L-fucosidase [Glycomyces sp. NPDC048151]|uniref:alpha-L-fucosidase n=1 Tax=Glycomyces sp. NPDC048151 TaxID=3364002 RepID=UPI0037162330